MLNKNKIGNYLKELRKNKINSKGKPYTQNDLSDEFMEKYNILISVNAIAEWENGKTLPTYENLEILSKIYSKSIDEIIEGEDLKEVNFKEEYFLYNDDWYSKVKKDDNPYQMRNNQILKITRKFKELIKIRISRDFTSNEEKEFNFLFNHFYSITEYCENYSKSQFKDDLLIFNDALKHLLVEIRNMSFDEKYWEVQKLYKEDKVLWFTFRLDVHDLKRVDILQERIEYLEDWEKDMLLAMFQNLEPYDANAAVNFGSAYLERYEKQFGEYNHDTVVKDEIRELINHGAFVNKAFLNVKEKVVENKRIIDRLEELYNKCLKPIEVYVDSDVPGEFKTYKIENNLRNRFINNYYFQLSWGLKFKEQTEHSYDDLQEVYDFFINNESIPKDMYIKLAKLNNIDINRDEKYWMADLKYRERVFDTFDEYKKNEKEISEGLEEIKKLKSLLESGEKEYQVVTYESIGGNDEDSIRDYIEYWKSDMDYNEFLKFRNKELTNTLLKDLDVLSLEEIKNKYFVEEVIENE